jgi:NAD(P)-dependent dehydrogenase (short-subunit alcohol dehydrogenase family)
MTGRLDGEHILVTGGSRSIGAAVVEKALGEGRACPSSTSRRGGGQGLVDANSAARRIAFARADIRSADDIARAHEAL